MIVKEKKNEMSRLIRILDDKKQVQEDDYDYNNENDDKNQQKQQQLINLKVALALLLIIVIFLISLIGHREEGSKSKMNDENEGLLRFIKRKEEGKKCMFCDIQTPPILHEEESYKINVGSNNDMDDDANTVTVTPMTITYNYELYNGQLLYTDANSELIPNVDFDYALLGMSGLRNVNRETNEPVSLDEVYLHHFTLLPLTMLGAEVLTRDESNPYMKFPDGYGLHVISDETPELKIGAHLLSNKNLAPIDGSIHLAHKHCNECYYAQGKGSDCTPEVTGTLKCCGDSQSCTTGGESCACATTSNNNNNNNNDAATTTVTKYQIQVDWLISRDIDKFERIDQWAFAAPACHVNLHGDSIFKEYSPDNYCYNNTIANVYMGGGSIFHQIELQDEDDNNDDNHNNPYVETKISYIAPTSGTIVWAQSHLHTGGVNATLRLNGDIICSTEATYGTNMDEDTNARNEQNHLIQIESCYETDIFQNGGIRFNEGDVITTESIYNGGINDNRFVGYGAGGEHKNVMSMFFTGVVLEGDATYLTEKRTSINGFGDLDNTFGLY